MTYINWLQEIANDEIKNETLTRKVNKDSRAYRGKYTTEIHGRPIVCPECNKVATVYHFSWSALSCQHCDTMIDKYDWKLL